MELGQFAPAIDKLQPLLNQADDESQDKAFPLICTCFLAQGYQAAAETTLLRWREQSTQPEIPDSIDAFIRSPIAKYYLDQENRIRDAGSGLLLAGRYLLSAPIESNPFGEIWSGFDRLTAKHVHIQIFDETVLQSDSFEKLIQEVQAVQMQSPIGAMQIHDLKASNGFLVLLPPKGLPLKKIVLQFTMRELRRYFYRLLDVIERFHEGGWHHTQLYPGNIFLGSRQVEVLGWGYRHLKSQLRTMTTGPDSPWRFCAPEVLKARPADARADIYTLAALLQWIFEMHQLTETQMAADWNAFFESELAAHPEDRSPNIEAFRQSMPLWPLYSAPEVQDKKSPSTQSIKNIPAGVVRSLESNAEYKLFSVPHAELSREEWVVETTRSDILERLLPWSTIRRGAQEVFRWQTDANQVYISPSTDAHLDLSSLRHFPYSLTRDLAAVADALQTLHSAGLGMGFFGVERGLGNYGPQLQLVPGSLPSNITPTLRAEDLEAFVQLVQFCFDLNTESPNNIWEELLHHLRQDKALSQQQTDTYLQLAPHQLTEWRDALDQLSHGLKQKRPQHVLAQIAADLKAGNASP
ncbi:MAG: hypothetical protein CMH56_04290 [Myxococcales bacterium]|nr:hypothetical protein [Myxococcales bacterium]